MLQRSDSGLQEKAREDFIANAIRSGARFQDVERSLRSQDFASILLEDAGAHLQT